MTWPYVTLGIPDELFERSENIPMTKAEVRAVALSKLRLKKGGVLVDVGCGTGSVSIEAALAMGEKSVVYAIDKNPEAVRLTSRNAEKFNVADRVLTIEGDAVETLDRVPPSDRYFVGGGGRRLPDILKKIFSKTAGGIVVIDVVTLDALRHVLEAVEGTRHEVIQIAVSRGKKAGGYTMLQALNPIFVITVYI